MSVIVTVRERRVPHPGGRPKQVIIQRRVFTDAGEAFRWAFEKFLERPEGYHVHVAHWRESYVEAIPDPEEERTAAI